VGAEEAREGSHALTRFPLFGMALELEPRAVATGSERSVINWRVPSCFYAFPTDESGRYRSRF